MFGRFRLTICGIAFAGSLALAGQASAQGMLTFNDGNFTDWTSTPLPTYPGQSVSLVGAGGNTGAYVQVGTTTSATTETEIYNPLFTYNTALSAIASLSYSLDINEFSTYGQGMAFQLMLLQGGQVFTGGYQITSGNGNVWQTRTLTGMTASDFSNAGSLHPDFSTSGGVITFGFLTGNDGGTGITVGYDNYHVQLTPAPEPTSLALLGLGGALIAVCRRKR